MFKKFLLSAFFLAIQLLQTSNCYAIEVEGRYYSITTDWILYNNEIDLLLTANAPKQLETTKVKLDGFGLSMAFGFDLEGPWAVEVEGGYRKMSSPEGKVRMGVVQLPVSANVYYSRTLFSVLEGYVGVGLGAIAAVGNGNFTSFYNYSSTAVYGSYSGDIQGKFMGNLRLGGSVYVASVLSIYMGYQLLVAAELDPWLITVTDCVTIPPSTCPNEVSVSGIKTFSHSFESGLRYFI